MLLVLCVSLLCPIFGDFSFSNRCFWTKAISIWTSTGDADHVMIVGSYFHYAGGFEPPQVIPYLIFSFTASSPYI